MASMPTARRTRAAADRRVNELARKVRLVVVDLDGVLTDGHVMLDATGREARIFHAADLSAVAILRRAGIGVVGLAARRPRVRPRWARAVGLSEVLGPQGQGVDAVRRHCARRRLSMDVVAYVGHDVLDLPLAEAVGFVISVADGSHQLRRRSHWVVSASGGGGVLREVAERVLRAQGKWASTIGEIWRQWD